MHIVGHVSVENLVHIFLGSNLEGLLISCQGINDVDLTHFLGESSYQILVLIFPPGRVEFYDLFGCIRSGISGRYVKVTAHRTQKLFCISARVYETFWLVRLRIEPVGNVSTSGEHDRITKLRGVVFLDQLGQIVDHVEEGYPAVIRGVMLGDLRG